MEGKLFTDTTRGTPQGGIVSPLLANIYLNELDRYMDSNYNGRKNRIRRRSKGMANFVHIRYADDFIVMCNGKHSEALAMKEELSQFLRTELKLTLSEEKTKVTHVNDGYRFLGFEIQRCKGTKGIMTTKTLMPKEAKESFKEKISIATDKTSHNASLKTKLMALNSIIRGWCNYYRYTSKANAEFRKLEYFVFWKVDHWIGRKYKMNMPDVMRKYYANSTFYIENLRLVQASSIKAKRYPGLFVIPNPYLKEEMVREEHTVNLRSWTGNENRPGVEDNRSWILERDNHTCQKCGRDRLDLSICHIDHIKPVRRFKNVIEASRLDNLQTLCISCHRQKTKFELQRENLVR
jgi:RNA-directed DNA polymerase